MFYIEEAECNEVAESWGSDSADLDSCSSLLLTSSVFLRLPPHFSTHL